MRKSPFLRVSASPVSWSVVLWSRCPILSPFTTRYSLLAVVSARQEPRPPISFRLPSHSKFGRANLPVSPKLLEGASPDAPKIFGRAEARSSKLLLMHQKIFGNAGALPSRKSFAAGYSPLAIRCSPSFPTCPFAHLTVCR